MIYTSLIVLAIILLLNYCIYKKYGYDKNLYFISSIFIIINFIFIHFIYYNNLSLGYENGIVFGDKLGLLATDEYKYYMESEHLVHHLKYSGGIGAYLRGDFATYPFKVDNKPYGIYNEFVVIISFLKYFGITKVVDLIAVKLIFTVINTYLFYSISRKFLSTKRSYFAVILVNLAPAYILVNTTLLRDNIILTFILGLILLTVNKEWNKKNIAWAILLIIGLVIFRVYTLVAIIFAILFTFIKSDKAINKLDFIFIALFIVGFFILDNFKIYIPHIEYLQFNLHEYFGSGLEGLVVFMYNTIKSTFVRGLFLNTLPTNSVYVILTVFGAIYYIILVPIFIYKIIILLFRNKCINKIWLCKFAIYFTFLNSIVLMLKDLMIPTRLVIMWYPLYIVIILLNVKNDD